MHCDQIAEYLKDYVAGELPPFKRSWVAQHIAGCHQCRALAAAAQRSRPGAYPPMAERAPVAAAADFLRPVGGPASVAVQRPVPPRVRRLLLLLSGLLLFGIIWLALGRTGSRHPSPLPSTHPLRFEARAQTHEGVTLSLKSLVVNGDQLRATLRFDGAAISQAADSWATVRTLGGERLAALPPVVSADTGGVTVQLAFRLPAEQSGFRLILAGVNSRASAAWALPLPAPPDRLEQFTGTLPGAPVGVALSRYGLVDGVLQVELTLSERLWGEIPKLLLRDSSGALFTPAAVAGPGSSGELTLHLPCPKASACLSGWWAMPVSKIT